MRHEKLNFQIELLIMLAENREWTIEDMCSRLNISKRSLYYYLESFKRNDLGLEKCGRYYSLSRNSRFISKLCDIVKFTEDEAITLKHLIEGVEQKTIQMYSALKKLERFYDFQILEDKEVRLKYTKLAETIYKAIKEEKILVIKEYSSPHSSTVTDRIVEPYLLFNGSHDLRAFELSSNMNKTFRLSRMGDVEILATPWQHKGEHKRMFTDIFNFTSEESTPTVLRLDQLAYNVLTEEFPRAEQDIKQEDEKYWIMTTNICSNIGIGRFILGMYDHIDILENNDLKKYIKDKIKDYSKKAKANHTTLITNEEDGK